MNINVDPVLNFIDRLQSVKLSGENWIAKCPAHADKNPSLTIRRGSDGRVLVHCFAGCPVDDIASAVGLEMKDLFVPSDPEMRKSYRRMKYRRELLEVLQHELLIMCEFQWTAERLYTLPSVEMDRAKLAIVRLESVVKDLEVHYA